MLLETVGTDVDTLCLRAARANAEIAGVGHLFHPVACDRFTAIRSNVFDTVVANPPYLPLEPKDKLDRTLCCGADLRLYISMLRSCARTLKKDGVLVFTASTLTAREVEGARLLRRVKTPFDTVLVYACRESELRQVTLRACRSAQEGMT